VSDFRGEVETVRQEIERLGAAVSKLQSDPRLEALAKIGRLQNRLALLELRVIDRQSNADLSGNGRTLNKAKSPQISLDKSAIVKRSLNLQGHITSVSLEEEFWEAAKRIAISRGVSVAQLINNIDARRLQKNLSSAIRLFVLAHYKNRAPEE
jgi:predicted DNA-binding ribbon-helix-helix protein